MAWYACKLRTLLGLVGTLWLALFLTVASVPRCSLFSSVSEDRVETKVSRNCHDEQAPAQQGAKVTSPTECRCMLLKGLVFRVAEPEVGSALAFRPRAHHDVEFVLIQSYEDVLLDQDVPYPKSFILS